MSTQPELADAIERSQAWIPTAPALNRILDAVAITPLGDKLVREVDCNQLADELLEAWSFGWLLGCQLDATSRRGAKAFRGAQTHARALKSDGASWAATFSCQSDLKKFLDGLDRIIEAAPHNPLQLPRAPIEWFVGEILKPIFERTFDHKATLRGPFVKFAVQVGKEMQIPLGLQRSRGLSKILIGVALGGAR